jgi:hypothetical protein
MRRSVMRNKWAGVRPIRFRNEIFGVIDLAATKRHGITLSDIRLCLLEERNRRDKLRINLFQRSGSLESSNRKREVMITKAEQMVRVLRATKVIEKEETGKYASTERAGKLTRTNARDPIEANSVFLEFLLNSKFRTYLLFLRKLDEKGGLVIPRRLVPKTKEISRELKGYLHASEFYMDSWSLFFMRDLFYDFGLLNYFFDPEEMQIFPLYEFTPRRKYLHQIHVLGETLRFWPSVALDTFLKQLPQVYLRLTENNWNRIVSIIHLREQFSREFRVPEQEFSALLVRAVAAKANYRVIPSVGVLDPSEVTASAIKALNLPTNEFGLPYTLVRMELAGG